MDSIDAPRQSAMMSQAGRCEADGQRARRWPRERSPGFFG